MSLPPLSLIPEQLTFAETAQFKIILKQFAAQMKCSEPGIVDSFNASNQTVSVQIALTELVRLPGGAKWKAFPVIDNVPIMFLGGGGFTVTVPLVKGDEGMLIFCDTCIDLWWAHGGVQPPVDAPIVQPQHERRRHDFWDCGFYPGMKSLPNMLANYSTSSLQVRSNDGTVIIDVAAAGITLTAPKVQINTTGDADATASSGNVNLEGEKVQITSSSTDVDLTASGNVNLAGTKYSISGLVSYPNNAAALLAGLTAGQLYRNGDSVGVVH